MILFYDVLIKLNQENHAKKKEQILCSIIFLTKICRFILEEEKISDKNEQLVFNNLCFDNHIQLRKFITEIRIAFEINRISIFHGFIAII